MTDNAGLAPGLNLLSFDSGGISGLSSLFILKEVMNRLQLKLGLDKRSDPWEHFDLIAGTGTGAICAVMLGRLRMSVDDAIRAYTELASNIYKNKKSTVSSGSEVFSSKKLEECLKAIIKGVTGDADERMVEENPRAIKCKVVVYAMSAYNMNAGLPCAFRTYPANANTMPDCPIWKALRASTAHPELFKSIEIDELGVGQYYVGGGLGCGNPTSQMLREAASLYPGRAVGSVVSIGTGHARTIQIQKPSWCGRLLPRTIPRALQVAHDLAIDNERIAEEVTVRFSATKGIYYRLNVGQGMQGIGPGEWEKQSEVASHTAAYMLRTETGQLIDALVEVILGRRSATKTHRIKGRASLLTAPFARAYTDCPPPTPLFIGRTKEVDIVRNYFEKDGRARKIFVLFGLGGAGKTQIALKVEGVLLIDGSSRQNIETSLSAFAISKHIGDAYMDAMRWLGSRGTRWLILFDNVDDPRVQVHEYFPRGDGYSILITTRHLEIVRMAEGDGAQYNISEFDPEDALRLLLKSAGLSRSGLVGSEKVAAIALLKKLGYLALAIAQCGAYICRNKCSFERYHKLLATEPEEMLGVTRTSVIKTPSQSYERSIHLTWDISYRQVSIASKRVLGLAAFLHRDFISESIFFRAYANAGTYQAAVPPTDTETNAQHEVKDILRLFTGRKGWSSRLFLEAMGELVCLSLVAFDILNQVYRLHPLVQEWTRALEPDVPIAVERSAFLLALSIGPGTSRDDFIFRRAVAPHTNEIMSLCPKPSSNNAWEYIEVYSAIGQVSQVAQLELQVLETRSIILGPDHPATLHAMVYVAGTHQQEGRLEQAMALFLQALATQQRVLGKSHTETLKTMAALARTYNDTGRRAEAEALTAETLAARRRLLGEDHPDTLASMSDLASTYNKQGRLSEAEELDKIVLVASKRVLGDDHPDTLVTMSNLAGGYYDQGRYAEAEALHLETLATRKRILGGAHPDTLVSSGWLALTYYKQGRFPEAEMLQVEMLTTQLQILGDNGPNHRTANTMRNLAWTYYAQGRHAECEALMAQANAVSANQ